MHIFLIGFMGSGKSYVGKRLANALQRPFSDLDDRIESGTGKTISAIFANEGELAFREQEAEYLRKYKNNTPAIIACGGGTPCYHGNIDWMNQEGLTIFLDPSLDLLETRLRPETAHRPLLAQQTDLRRFLKTKLMERRPAYEKAQIRMVVGNPDTDVVRLILDHLNYYYPELK
ncbi:MAG: shikimate kinase [Bacteroidota bacterium]